MKKLLVLLTLSIILILSLTGCELQHTTVYKNLIYQESFASPKGDILFIFTNDNSEKTVLTDFKKKGYFNVFVKNRKYDIEVTVDNDYQWGNDIRNIIKSE
jgi:hypothetical protein